MCGKRWILVSVSRGRSCHGHGRSHFRGRCRHCVVLVDAAVNVDVVDVVGVVVGANKDWGPEKKVPKFIVYFETCLVFP